MTASNQYTIRLANGNERTFGSAAAMVKWMNRQRELEYRGKTGRRRPDRPVAAEGKPKKVKSEAPLAAFARRHSANTQQSL